MRLGTPRRAVVSVAASRVPLRRRSDGPPGSAAAALRPLTLLLPGAAHGAPARSAVPPRPHAGAGTCYFTGGGAGPVLPGRQRADSAAASTAAPPARTSAGGKRIFGGGVATDAPPSGGDRSPRLGPSAAANDATAGHMGTPWADRRARRERAEASRDDLDLAADLTVPSSSSSSTTSRWVTVFGYAPDRLAGVLRELQRDRGILRHEGDGDANWRHVQFSDVERRRVATRRTARGRHHGGGETATADDVSRLDERRAKPTRRRGWCDRRRG